MMSHLLKFIRHYKGGEMHKILVFLQNAYGVEDGYIPTFERESFAHCYTGKRLKEMLPVDSEVIIRNACPRIGDKSNSNLPPDWEYIASELECNEYDVVLACGKNARVGVNKALSYALCSIPVVYAPHPAWRKLSKSMTSEIRNELSRT
jgi:hypothetical protein